MSTDKTTKRTTEAAPVCPTCGEPHDFHTLCFVGRDNTEPPANAISLTDLASLHAAASGNHRYASVLAEAAREIILLRRLLIEARSTRAADIVADGWANRVDAAIGDQPHAE
jgi:hypothetical protein